MSKMSIGRLFLAAALASSAAPGLWGQEKPQEKQAQASGQAAAKATSEATAQAENSAGAVRAGTKISAELVSTVDTRTAKPGQEVVARVTKDVKQKGQTVVRKGDRLIGKIQSVEANAAADAGSRMAVTFDRVAHGESTSELHTMVSAILSTPREQRQRMEEPAPMPAPAPAPRGNGSAGGGLVGGATSAVGSTANAATSTVGGVGSAVGSTVGVASETTLGAGGGAMLATPARAIRIESQAGAENQTSASSMLSTREGHLRLESGTQMQFRVAAQSEAQAKKSEAPAKKQ